MKNQLEGKNTFPTQFYYELGNIVNDMFVLAKEFEWSRVWDEKVRYDRNISSFQFEKVYEYFDDISDYPFSVLIALERLLEELWDISRKIKKLSDEECIWVKKFIQHIIYTNEWISGSSMNSVFQDILFFELWIDGVDEVWEAREEMAILLNKVMMRR